LRLTGSNMARYCRSVMQESRTGLRFPARLRVVPAALLLAAAACSPAAAPPARSVLLVTLDTTRADALGCYGNGTAFTPNLDALARESLLYTEARASAPITLPSHASMMTGLYPPRHTVRDNGLTPLPPSAVTVAERARAAGFQTAAVVSAVVLDRSWGIAQGFDRFEAPLPDPQNGGIGVESWTAEEVLPRVERWLTERDPARPFFLWVHFFDAHQPYRAPADLLRRTGGDPYLAEVALVDRVLGRLTARLREEGLLKRTFLLIAGDHGEALGDHGESTHGAACFDATLKVPLLLRYPDGWRAGERSGEIVSTADVGPTLLEAMGLTPPSDLDGSSLYRRSVPPGRGVYFESYYGFLNFGWSPLVGWVDRDGKYLLSSRPKFFELDRDPGETRDRLAENEAAARRARKAIEAVRARPSLPIETAPAPGEEALEAIRDLGYAAAGDPEAVATLPLEAPGRPGPEESLGELRRILQAVQLEKNGKRGEAVGLLRKVVASNPANGYALEILGRFLFFEKDYRGAQAVLERRLALGPRKATVLDLLGHCREELGSPAAALPWYRQALLQAPRNAHACEDLARVLKATGRDDEAARMLEQARRLGGGAPR